MIKRLADMKMSICFASLGILFFSACKSKNRTYTLDDVMNDTLTESRMFANAFEVEQRNSKLYAKYIYSNKSNVKAIFDVISLSIGNIERYIGQLPETRTHKLNEAPAVYGKRWHQIEPLYLKTLSAIRIAIQNNPQAGILYEKSAHVKCTIDDLEGAIQDLLTAIRLDPNCSDCYEHLGYYYELNNEFSKACESLRKARDLGAEIQQSDIRLVCDN
jgi:tetratricopeptide (TPR) repeat protein